MDGGDGPPPHEKLRTGKRHYTADAVGFNEEDKIESEYRNLFPRSMRANFHLKLVFIQNNIGIDIAGIRYNITVFQDAKEKVSRFDVKRTNSWKLSCDEVASKLKQNEKASETLRKADIDDIF